MAIPEYTDLLNDWNNCSLSDFCKLPIMRTNQMAEIIVAYYQGDENKPVRLIGFKTSSEKSDFEIHEEGYLYFCELIDNIQKNLN